MRTSTTVSRKTKIFIIGIWLLIWQGVCIVVGKDVLVPSPLRTLSALFIMMQSVQFYYHIIYTLWRVFLGVLISFIIALLTAVLSNYQPFIKAFLQPMILLMKATPVMAIIILALLWFQSDTVPIFVCFLMCYPIVYTNILTGMEHLDEELIELSKVFRVKCIDSMYKCYFPQLKPYLHAALELASGMAFKVVIAAEVLAVPKYAMGYELLNAKIYLETQQVFAWVLVIIGLSQLCSMGINQLFNMRRKND